MLKYRAYTDLELLTSIKGADGSAFKELYDRYWAVLYRHACHMLGQEEEAKDIVQEVFLVVWDKAADLQIQSSLSSYLYAAVRNRILNQIEKNRVRQDYRQIYEASFHDFDCITDDTIRQNELQRLIEKEIDRLPQKMQTVFKLSRQCDQSYKQIAETLSISEQTVKKQISNAIRILRIKLGAFLLMTLLFFL